MGLNALRLRGGMGATQPPYPTTLYECAQVLREAHDGSGPATAGVWGRHQPPHESILAPFSKCNRLCFIKSYPPGFMPERASLGMQHPVLPGAWGEQPHKSKPPHPKPSTLFSKNHLHKILCPRGHHLGLNALRLRGGMGAAQAPISEAYPLQTREAFMPERASLGMQHPLLPGA